MVVALGLLLTAFLQIPYWLGDLTAPASELYTGLLVNVEDANYITIIQRGSEGAWMHSLRFTSEPDAPAFLYVFYLAWGHLARLAQWDATTTWHIARFVMSVLVFIVTFGFVRTFVAARAAQWVAFGLAILGGGFDWVAFPWETLAPTSATPIDLKMADAHLFHSALTFPHYLASITLLLILFWCALRLCNENLARAKFFALVVLGALANNGVVLVYPFFVLLSCGVLGMYGILLMLRAKKMVWRQVTILLVLILSTVPLVLYYAYAFASSELLRVWAAQSQTLSPNPLHYVLTFAPYLFLALLDFWRVGVHDNKRLLLWIWLLVVALLVYAPLGAQRRFLQGVQVPLAILATFGLFEVALPRIRSARWFQKLSTRPNYSAQGLERLIIVAFLWIISVSSAYQWLSAIALTVVQQPYPLFRPRAEVEAMDWLLGHADSNQVVLSSYFSGSYLPFRSGMRVYLGHVYETIHFDAKQKLVDTFLAAETNDAARLEFLRANKIEFLFYGRAEREVGGFDPARAAYLKLVFRNQEASVYQVTQSE